MGLHEEGGDPWNKVVMKPHTERDTDDRCCTHKECSEIVFFCDAHCRSLIMSDANNTIPKITMTPITTPPCSDALRRYCGVALPYERC